MEEGMRRSLRVAFAAALLASVALPQQQPSEDKRKTVPQGYHLENGGPAGEELPRENPAPVEAAVVAPVHGPQTDAPRDDFGDLSAGRIEVNAFGGINYAYSRASLAPRVPASYGSVFAVGVARFVAVTLSGVTNRLGTLNAPVCSGAGCSRVRQGGTIAEVMVGARLFMPRRRTVTPHASVGVGLVQFDADSANVAGLNGLSRFTTLPADRFAIASGAGLDFKFSRRVGAMLNVELVRPTEIHWYFRSAAGMYLRFR
jgi:opacity protein-like surface antigen